MQETTTDNTTPLVVSQLDEGKNDKSATCLTNHNCNRYVDKSTQTPVLFDECLSPLEYELTTEKPHQCSESSTIYKQMPIECLSSLGYESMTGKPNLCSESSTVCSQMPLLCDEYLSSLGYESMTGKPYQCSESSTEITKYSETSVELPHQAIARKMDPGFLVCGCDSPGEKPNEHNVDHTTNDIKVISLAVLQHKSKYDKSANCLTNEGPLDHTTQISYDECLNKLEHESTTTIAQQCTEGFPCKSGHRFVMASLKTTIPQEIDCNLLVGSPGSGFWPNSKITDKQTIVVSDYKTAECDEKTLLLPVLRHFLSTSGEKEKVEQDIWAVNICTIILYRSNYSDMYTVFVYYNTLA